MILNLSRKEIGFENIHGYDDIKDIVKRALDAEDNYNLLFVGPPASSKTLFLLGILEYKKGVYIDGSNTTNRILDVLDERRPKIICIDELDKMPKQFQENGFDISLFELEKILATLVKKGFIQREMPSVLE
jgi:hypothetical protein